MSAVTGNTAPDIALCAMIIAGEFQPDLNIDEELAAIEKLVADARAFPVVNTSSLVEFLSI